MRNGSKEAHPQSSPRKFPRDKVPWNELTIHKYKLYKEQSTHGVQGQQTQLALGSNLQQLKLIQ